MKKLILAIGAVVLLGIASSCEESMSRVDNPNYDPIKDVVTTQFVLNIAPAENASSTKQSGNAVQRYQNFRGLGNATLFTVSVTKRLMSQNSDDLVDGMMIPFITHEASGSSAPVSLQATSVIPLSTALGVGTIDPTGSGIDPTTGTGTPKSRRIIEVTLPTNTNTLLFYGEAITGEDEDALNTYGGLEYTSTSADLTEIGCRARPRMKEGTVKAEDFDKIGDMILTVINHLFLVGVNGDNLWDGQKKYGYEIEDTGHSFNFGTAGGALVSVHWKDFKDCKSTDSNTPLYTLFNKTVPADGVPKATQLEILLGTAYNAFTEIAAGELRAGSGMSIERQIQDLYSVMYDACESAATSDQEAVAKVICEAVRDYIKYFFTINPTTMGATWKTMKGNDGVQKMINDHVLGASMPLPTNADVAYTLHSYPFHFDLPSGATTLVKNPNYGDPNKPDKDMIFVYNTKDISLSGMGGGSMSVYDYTYPPSLCYFGNSPIRISRSNSMTNRSFPDGVKDANGSIWENKSYWEDLGVWVTNPEFGHVTADTRGVAMAFNIQYGNALMETEVKFDDSDNAATSVKLNGGKLVDNNAHMHTGEADKEYSIGNGKTISLTGVLIGGQPDKVGWTYMAKSDAEFNQMIYDKMINGGTRTEDSGVYHYRLDVPTDYATTTPNYTVVFDNYVEAAKDVTADQNGQKSTVYVALEFQNNLGEDFWGNENMVRNGGTFYIVGKLQLANAKRDKFSWDNCSKIMPPYVATAQGVSTKRVERIFMADHTTKVTFVIGKNSLKSAYVTVPDLRAAKMEIGLSVDLEWQDGLYFDNVVLGAE